MPDCRGARRLFYSALSEYTICLVCKMPSNTNNKDSARNSRSSSSDANPDEPCACGKCGKTVSASSSSFECFSCCCSVLAACLGMNNATYSYLAKTANFLFVCEICKCESVPASAELKELKMTVQKITEVICPDVSPLGEGNADSDGGTGMGEEQENPWTMVTSKSQKRSFAKVATTQAPLCKAMATTITQAIAERERDEKQKRTIVVENCASVDGFDDSILANQLCAQIHPNICVVGVQRMQPRFPVKSKSDSVKADSPNDEDANSKKSRPPILKVVLRSAEDKALALKHKSALKDGDDWMQEAFVRPSLSLHEGERRDLLFQVIRARNGQKPDKENRHLVWLNLNTEKYELRQVENGQWVKFSDVAQPTAEELRAAAISIENRNNSNANKKKKEPASTAQSASSKNGQ